jgi:hypothetical protein
MEMYLHSSIHLNDEIIKAILVWIRMLEKARPLSKLQCQCAVMIRQLLGCFCYACSVNDGLQGFRWFCVKRNTDATSGSYEVMTSRCNGHVACNFCARAQQKSVPCETDPDWKSKRRPSQCLRCVWPSECLLLYCDWLGSDLRIGHLFYEWLLIYEWITTSDSIWESES